MCMSVSWCVSVLNTYTQNSKLGTNTKLTHTLPQFNVLEISDQCTHIYTYHTSVTIENTYRLKNM